MANLALKELYKTIDPATLTNEIHLQMESRRDFNPDQGEVTTRGSIMGMTAC